MYGLSARTNDGDLHASDRSLKIPCCGSRGGDADSRLAGIHINVGDASARMSGSRARMNDVDASPPDSTLNGSERTLKALDSRLLTERCNFGVRESDL